jgi:hypothetical protein
MAKRKSSMKQTKLTIQEQRFVLGLRWQIRRARHNRDWQLTNALKFVETNPELCAMRLGPKRVSILSILQIILSIALDPAARETIVQLITWVISFITMINDKFGGGEAVELLDTSEQKPAQLRLTLKG